MPEPRLSNGLLAPRDWLWPVLVATFVMGLYLLPQALYTLHGHAGAELLQEDELLYVSRLVRALQGQPAMSPLLYEHRDALSVVAGFTESALAAPFRLGAWLGLPLPSAASVVVFYRGLFAFLGVLALTFALCSVGLSMPLATLVALWTHVDKGVSMYKPLLGLTWIHFGYNRLTNPLVALPVFCLAWGCWARALMTPAPRRSWTIAAGCAAGLLFYTNFYYWTLFVAICAVTSLPDLRRRLPLAAAVAGIALLISARYWVYALSFRGSAQYLEIVWRSDFFRRGRGVSYPPNKTLLPMAAFAIATFRIGTPAARFQALSVAAGIILYYSTLVTGVEMPNSLQNDHWHYALAPMIFATCLFHALYWAARTRLAVRYAKPAYALLTAVLMVGGAINFVRYARETEHSPQQGAGPLDPAYEPAWTWLREHASHDSVILADERTMAHAVLKAGTYIWIHYTVYPDPVSFEEILDRYRVLWLLDGTQPQQLDTRIQAHYAGLATWFWPYGLTQELAAQLRDDDWPPLEIMRFRAFKRGVMEASAHTTLADVHAIAEHRRLDYLVRGPNESHWPDSTRYLDLEPVFQTAHVRIDRVLRVR